MSLFFFSSLSFGVGRESVLTDPVIFKCRSNTRPGTEPSQVQEPGQVQSQARASPGPEPGQIQSRARARARTRARDRCRAMVRTRAIVRGRPIARARTRTRPRTGARVYPSITTSLENRTSKRLPFHRINVMDQSLILKLYITLSSQLAFICLF